MQTHDVFGIAPELREASYVDRGELDNRLSKTLKRTTHVAIRGPSKCGKSWLRQKVVQSPLVVQCRLHKSCIDIYVDALSQLDIRLQIKDVKTSSFKATVSATAQFGIELLAKVGITTNLTGTEGYQEESEPVGKDIDDLRFIANIIKASERRLIIEDFHYMSTEHRKAFSFDLKTLWDYGLYVIIVGIWSQTNLLLYLNQDLAGRVTEIAIDWNKPDLSRILEKGSEILGLNISESVKKSLVDLAYSNAGVLQQLTILVLDEAGIEGSIPGKIQDLDSEELVDDAAMEYAEQLNPIFQQFSKNVSKGIRERKKATGIYAHAMAAIIDQEDDELINGVSAKLIYSITHARQSRIQLSNLKTILEKIPELQVDSEGRGLILTYNSATEEVSVVDRQLLLYRRYATLNWPWEDLIREADEEGGQYEMSFS